ncbi:hypothetical protein KIN20_038116 [Parelaphostrongylus tenuis]|uniref:Uncharacterized protein n=1 Tax=Parelaphostrongylus tenuis TaxID=148309 RepID=A0AAD5WMB8_PARTN|nr:hypothetical protein KIN20_038116 [Parelaphostrongylus tenuis]
MSANGNKQVKVSALSIENLENPPHTCVFLNNWDSGMGSYLHVLPDSSEKDEPIYSLGASFYGGLEPAGAKMGYLTRPLGK